jgi:hypothetical protein
MGKTRRETKAKHKDSRSCKSVKEPEETLHKTLDVFTPSRIRKKAPKATVTSGRRIRHESGEINHAAEFLALQLENRSQSPSLEPGVKPQAIGGQRADNSLATSFDSPDSSPVRTVKDKTPPWLAAEKGRTSAFQEQPDLPAASVKKDKNLKLRLSFDIDSDVNEPSSPVQEVNRGPLRRSARNVARTMKSTNTSVKGWKTIGTPKHKADKEARTGISYPVEKLPRAAHQDPAFFVNPDNKERYSDFFTDLDNHAKGIEKTLVKLQAEVDSEFVDKAEDHPKDASVVGTPRNSSAGVNATRRHNTRKNKLRRYSEYDLVYAEPRDLPTQRSQDEKQLKNDIESSEVDCPNNIEPVGSGKTHKRKMTCTKATKKDAIRLKSKALDLMQFPESEKIHAELLLRFERMFFVHAEMAQAEGTDMPSLVKVAMELRAFMHHIRPGRIITGELVSIIDHEIEWADWIYETCATGVMHLNSDYCDCKTEWDSSL